MDKDLATEQALGGEGAERDLLIRDMKEALLNRRGARYALTSTDSAPGPVSHVAEPLSDSIQLPAGKVFAAHKRRGEKAVPAPVVANILRDTFKQMGFSEGEVLEIGDTVLMTNRTLDKFVEWTNRQGFDNGYEDLIHGELLSTVPAKFARVFDSVAQGMDRGR